MSDTKESMPAQPKTTELPAVPAWAVELTRYVKEGISRLDGSIGDIEQNVQMLVGQGKALTKWRGEMDAWREEVDGRLRAGSIRAKEPSQHDVEIRAELSEERKAREALALKVADIETKTDEQTKALARIESAVTGFFKNPKVIFVGKVIFALAVAYSGAKGLKVLP